tara:strand:+ start:708 stop:833 length:126 start_codon:yes stop_codon:yes gene_type:complete
LVLISLMVPNFGADITGRLINEVRGIKIATVYNFFATSDLL